jgi:hypothetical protein
MPQDPTKIVKLNRLKAPPVTSPFGSEEWKEEIATRALVEGPFAGRGTK